MNSEQIMAAYVQAVCDLADPPPQAVSLPSFQAHCRAHQDALQAALPADCPHFDALKPVAVMRILVLAVLERSRRLGPQIWSREGVRALHGATVDGVDYLYYPSAAPERMLVHFSSMAVDKFDRYSRYWDATQEWRDGTVHLFFKDEQQSYFLGTDAQPTSSIHARLMRQFRVANGLSESQVFTLGSSMGGYGALYYAMTQGFCGAMVYAPQVTQRAMTAHTHDNWSRFARATGTQWVDLDMLAHRTSRLPYVYLESGNYPADRLASDALIQALGSKSGLLLHRRTDWVDHTRTSVLPREVVTATISLFETNRAMEAAFQS